MKITIILLVLLVIVTYATSKFKDKPTCVKIDECSCHFTGAEQSGVIDLHSLVSGQHEPAFVTQVDAYKYYYNPCMKFSSYGCPNTSTCQVAVDGSAISDLGNLDNVTFQYDDYYISAVYRPKPGEHKEDLNFL